jgi:putative transposase
MLATGFFHVDCAVSLHRLYCFFVIEAGSRYVHIPGITTNPDRPWTTQQIRNLLMDPGGRAAGFRFLVRDRAGQFTACFGRCPGQRRHRSGEDPAPQPSCECLGGAVVLTARTEVTDPMLIAGERHLRTVLAGYQAHYNRRRPIAAASFALPSPITPWPTCPSSGSGAGPSWAASSTNTRGSPKSPAQDQRQSFGTPHLCRAWSIVGGQPDP